MAEYFNRLLGAEAASLVKAKRQRRLRPALEPAPPAGDGYHHNVYVILLDPSVASHPSVLRLNPKRDPAKPCLYVGMTGLDPAERFANHKRGHKAAWTVRKYGLRLLPEFYECFNPMPFEAGRRDGAGLAEDLRAEGYTVDGRQVACKYACLGYD